MNIVNRAINILTKPKSEWPVIDAEPATPGGLITGYAAILALLPAIGALLGAVIFMGRYLDSAIGFIIVTMIIVYIVAVGVTYVMGMIVPALAPSFDGSNNPTAGMKLVVYSGTAVWVAGFFAQLLGPMNWGLSLLLALIGYGYAAYLLYLGSMAVVKVPENKAVGFTVVVIIIWFIVAFIISAILGAILLSGMMGGAMINRY